MASLEVNEMRQDGECRGPRANNPVNWRMASFCRGAELLYRRGQSLDAFDIAFEANRKEGDDSEPGDDPNCPCRKEHFFVTSVERLLAAELGVDWAEYDAAIYAL